MEERLLPTESIYTPVANTQARRVWKWALLGFAAMALIVSGARHTEFVESGSLLLDMGKKFLNGASSTTTILPGPGPKAEWHHFPGDCLDLQGRAFSLSGTLAETLEDCKKECADKSGVCTAVSFDKFMPGTGCSLKRGGPYTSGTGDYGLSCYALRLVQRDPTYGPTGYPALRPTLYGTEKPQWGRTGYPGETPTDYPAEKPTGYPGEMPTRYPPPPEPEPEPEPAWRPTGYPAEKPTGYPGEMPTNYPADGPTGFPGKRSTLYGTDFSQWTYECCERVSFGRKCCDRYSFEDCCPGVR